MTKIIHSGDLHLDTPLTGFASEKAEICRSERLLSFEKTIDEVIKTKAEILLLAGDLFENENVSFGTVRFLKKCFARIPDTYVFIAPGNHDCLTGNRVYSKGELGENVHVFSDELDFKEIESKNIRVYGYGFRGKFVDENVLSNFRVKDDKMANILVMHCSLPPYKDTNPVTLEQIKESGLDYIAAGHIHAGGKIQKQGKTYFAYCGTPQGFSFDEVGKKGIICGDIEQNSVNLEFIKTSKREVCIKEADVSGCTTNADVVAMFKDLNPENIYKIILRGKIHKQVVLNKKVIKEMLEENVFFAKIYDETEIEIDKAASLAEKLFLEKLSEKGMSEAVTERAKKIGLCALGGDRL